MRTQPLLKRKCIIANSLSHIDTTCVYILFHTFTSEAVVGLENTFYEVSEGAGVIEVCAVVYSPSIDCPIVFPFNISLSTINNTAGIVNLLYSLLMLSDIKNRNIQEWQMVYLHIYRGIFGLY